MKRLAASILAVALVATLCAVPAYASEPSELGLQTATVAPSAIGTASETASGTAADSSEPASPAKVDVYVLSKIGDMKCTYNAKGLITKRANSTTTLTFKYSGTNMKSYTSKFKHGRSQSSTKGTLTYKSGRLVKLVTKGTGSKTTETYSYNKAGRVSKYAHSATNQQKIKYTCSYDAAGRMVKRNASGGSKTKATFSYDGKGNMLSAAYLTNGTWGYTYDYANKYKSGRLTKKVATITSRGSLSTTTNYTYKKLTVPAQYAQAVADQQWALLNPEVSFSYPLNY